MATQTPLTNSNIQSAVNDWISDPTQAIFTNNVSSPLPEESCRIFKVPACKFREKTLRNPCPICKIRGKNPTSGICKHVNL